MIKDQAEMSNKIFDTSFNSINFFSLMHKL